MLILEIAIGVALGIALGFFVLAYWRKILSVLGVIAALAVAAVALFFFVTEIFQPFVASVKSAQDVVVALTSPGVRYFLGFIGIMGVLRLVYERYETGHWSRDSFDYGAPLTIGALLIGMLMFDQGWLDRLDNWLDSLDRLTPDVAKAGAGLFMIGLLAVCGFQALLKKNREYWASMTPKAPDEPDQWSPMTEAEIRQGEQSQDPLERSRAGAHRAFVELQQRERAQRDH